MKIGSQSYIAQKIYINLETHKCRTSEQDQNMV